MSVKQERMADRIREILSSLLLTEVTDPALTGITVTEVRLDAELEYADVFVNALGDESRQRDVLKGLSRANSFLRRQLGARIRLRRTPNLHFHWDLSLERVEKIEQVLSRLVIPPAPPETIDSSPSTEDQDDS